MAPDRGLTFLRTRLAGRLEVDAVVIGSGLTACLSAAWLARDGVRVALVATDRLGDEAACGIGLIGVVPALQASEARAAHGVRATRAIWSATRKAGADLMSALARWRAPCGLERLPFYLVGSDEGQAVALEREQAALVACGGDPTWLGPGRVSSTLGIERGVAMRLSDADGAADPVRAVLACARAAVAEGALAIERLAIDRIARTRLGVEVQAGRHVVAAATCVVATSRLPREYGALRRHLSASTVATCALAPLAPAPRRRFGRPAVCEVLGPAGLAWRLTPGGRMVISRHLQAGLDPADRGAALGATGALMYDFSLHHPHVSGEQPVSRWLQPALSGIDGLPVAGGHRAFPRHVFAFARADRLAECALAARVAVGRVTGADHAAADHLDFSRVR